MNIIIPGFGSQKFLFEEFILLSGNPFYLDLKTYTYKEAETVLKRITGTGEKLNIFAWSLGSLFALKWTIENTDSVLSVFLTGATARFSEKEGYNNGISEDVVKKMLKLTAIKKEIIMNNFYNTILEKVEGRNKYIDKLMRRLPETSALESGLKELLNIDMLKHSAGIKVPVLIYQGDEDNITPMKGAEILSRIINSAELKIYKGGHTFFLEYPRKCSDEWRKFICTIKE